MDSDGIFLLRHGELKVLEAKGFEAEDVLQEALAKHPEVLAGQSTVGGTYGRLLLISREVGVPISESSGAWFSADHVFIDSEAVPVVVETKRSSDTRSRREVVAQLLEYAANGTKYWSVEGMQESLRRRAEAEGTTAENLLSELQSDLEDEKFWDAVGANLSQGRVRLVIVADRISPELERIVEFLNEQFVRTELLAVELKHYTDGDQRVLVPRVVGKTIRAADVKSTGTWWDETSFMRAAAERCPDAVVAVVTRLFNHVKARGGRLNFGRGQTPGVSAWYPIGAEKLQLPVWTANVGSGEPGSNPYLYLWPMEEKADQASSAIFETGVRALLPFAASKGKAPSARLAVLASAADELQAFEKLIDTFISSASLPESAS